MNFKRYVALFLTGTMLLNSAIIANASYTDEEIEKRINEVGQEYLDFYREGYFEIEEEDYSYNTSSGSGGGGLLEALVDAVAPSSSSNSKSEEVMFEAEAGLADQYDAYYPGYEDLVPLDTEEYSSIKESGFISTKTQPFSTFGADVDTASYSSLRKRLLEPVAKNENDPNFYGIDDSAIRIEEMINYFNYDYAKPEDGEKFGVTTVLTQCPWNESTLLFKVGIKAEEYKEDSKGSNIVFLIDTSGSMFDFDSLPLVKKALAVLVDKLDRNDTISIVTYAGSEEVLLEDARGDEKEEILDAINGLEAWGSTYGEGGINKAYEIAEKYYIEGGNNRVVLCTDGDFNVGVSSEAGLKDLISEKRESNIFFSCLGFGTGNYSDTTMETLADNGNGNYAYIDCLKEADKALNEEFFSTIYTVAKDVKFQVEFNPETVKGYRLIGYENRAMAAEDFANDAKDGGEVGAGQTVTVLYEVVPVGSDYEIPSVTSHFGNKEETENEVSLETQGKTDNALMCLSIRYKEPEEDKSELYETYITKSDIVNELDPDTSWAAGIAQAGMLMRDSEYAGTSTFDNIFDRLKEDPEIMDNDFKAELLFMLRYMKKYKAES